MQGTVVIQDLIGIYHSRVLCKKSNNSIAITLPHLASAYFKAIYIVL